MKRLSLLVVAVVVLAMSAAPRADALGLFGSWWDSDSFESGFGVGAKHRIKFTVLAVDLRGSWIGFDGVNVVPLEVTGLLDLGIVYGGVGAGYYIFISGYTSELGFYGMGGVAVSIFGIGAFGELKYTWVEPKLEDVTFDSEGPGVNIGVLLGW